jgi:hypothetical protein
VLSSLTRIQAQWCTPAVLVQRWCLWKLPAGHKVRQRQQRAERWMWQLQLWLERWMRQQQLWLEMWMWQQQLWLERWVHC